MDLIFAGGLHWHPDCRSIYQGRLRTWVAARGRPSFVAVEWDDGVAKSRIGQRRLYRDIWLRTRAQDAGSPIRKLATRLAWESDGHKSIIRRVPIVWLDNGRPQLPSQGPFATNRLVTERFVLGGPKHTAIATDVAMASINAYWIAEAEETQKKLIGQRDAARDHVWFDRIRRSIRVFGGDWAVVVVGAIHASEWDRDTLFCLLSGHFNCRTSFLVWKPTLPGKPCQ